jgi:hypothetical protein
MYPYELVLHDEDDGDIKDNQDLNGIRKSKLKGNCISNL